MPDTGSPDSRLASPSTPSRSNLDAVTPSRTRPIARLFVLSFVILFTELACIRWFGSTVVFLTFFSNLVLMACFLGMSVGCLAASKKRDFVNGVIPLLLVASTLACLTLTAYMRIARLTIDVGIQKQPQQIFFGTEARPVDPSQFVIPIEVLAGVFFVLVALVFVGLGQEMGRCFNAIPNRVTAYSTDIFGSLTGIVAFGLASYFQTPPLVWFAVVGGLVLPFVTRRRGLQWLLLLVSLVVFAYGSYRAELMDMLGPPALSPGTPVGDGSPTTVWSPYYKVEYMPVYRTLYTNNIAHQAMKPIPDEGRPYLLPHLLNRDSGGAPFKEVLIVGAGSGNDVRAALVNGAERVDAVEIDRALTDLGRLHHPDRPFADGRVFPHFDDGRDYVHNTDRKFDLINYAVVDSLVLHSGYSSLRLESFLFTEEALRDIKAKLKPGGMFAMYNYYRQGWVVGRLEKMVERVFGMKPLVMTVPFKEEVKPEDAQRGAITLVLAGNGDGGSVAAIRKAFAEKGSFWSYNDTRLNINVNGFSPAPTLSVPDDQVARIAPAKVDTTGIDLVPSDNWPFLYLRERVIPALNVRGIVLVAVLSLALLATFAPVRTVRPSGRMFFLGAGFMLLETKGVVHMALLFGSTWVVNSFVFFAILVMILLSNLYVQVVNPKKLGAYFVLLAAALTLNIAVPMATYLSLPGVARVVVSCSVVFIPVFFAGVIFATSFRDSAQPDVDFGTNIGGVILGGLSENLSLVLGFNNLLLLAIVYYALAAALGPRKAAG